MMPAPGARPKIGPRETIYENRYQRVQRVRVDFGGFAKEYFVNETGTRAGVLAVRNGSVLLVQQYRLLIDRVSWQIPGGRVDPGETPEVAALRECLEETGIRCHNPRPLVFYYPGLDTLDNRTYLFYTDDIADVSHEGCIHKEEVTGYGWHPLAQCIEMIFTRQIVHGFSIAALLAFRTFLDCRSER
jgi:ADP-ribose pyrophosphatase